ncbi:hypothetical protein U9M48_002786 [Paspalum notatum var. saurae]|uniref:Uncharacterized protein n=1 Tax=Paspalum notatum var. saurae TaxID=547442 RepID=A0AAQ3PS46_PASNO
MPSPVEGSTTAAAQQQQNQSTKELVCNNSSRFRTGEERWRICRSFDVHEELSVISSLSPLWLSRTVPLSLSCGLPRRCQHPPLTAANRCAVATTRPTPPLHLVRWQGSLLPRAPSCVLRHRAGTSGRWRATRSPLGRFRQRRPASHTPRALNEAYMIWGHYFPSVSVRGCLLTCSGIQRPGFGISRS